MHQRPSIPSWVWIAPLCVIGLLIATWLIMANVTRGPIAGEARHDFGMVQVTGPDPAILTHTFRLTNRRDVPITIAAIRPDCGCLTVDADLPLTVNARQQFELPITMHYNGSDPQGKTVTIRLDCGAAGLSTLRVTAKPQK